MENKIIGGIAKKWILSEDKTILKLFIRDDAKFSDGSSITSKDVASTIKRACLKKSSFHFQIHKYLDGIISLKHLDDTVDSIEIISPLELNIKFNTPIDDVITKLSLVELGYYA